MVPWCPPDVWEGMLQHFLGLGLGKLPLFDSGSVVDSFCQLSVRQDSLCQNFVSCVGRWYSVDTDGFFHL